MTGGDPMSASLTVEQQARIERLTQLRAASGADLAVGVLELIEDNRDRWNQGNWRLNGLPEEKYEQFREDPLAPECRTSFCKAGWIAAIDGVKWFAWGGGPMPVPRSEDEPSVWDLSSDQVGNPAVCDCLGAACVNPEHALFVRDYAAERLGLDERQADILFHGANTIGDLRLLVDAMVAGEDLCDQEQFLERTGESGAVGDAVSVDDD